MEDNKTLFVYKDNEDPASATYLNMIKKTAAEKNVDVIVVNDLFAIRRQFDCGNLKPRNCGVLVMQPYINLTREDLIDFFSDYDFGLDIDNVTNGCEYPGATAQGIFNYITSLYPERGDGYIGVIGRGVVGGELLHMLIKYGYTVVAINSKTDYIIRDELLKHCNVIVGLSAKNKIVSQESRAWIESLTSPCTWIDAGTNFDFADRTTVKKCGKWTREVLFSRLWRD